MKKIDLDAVPTRSGSGYPPPYNAPVMARSRKRLGQAAGLTEFGVNLLTLPPGAWSSQRHWHSHEDEFIFVVEGQVTLVTDAGEEILSAGDSAGFKAGDPDAHHLVNRSERDSVVLEVGNNDGDRDRCVYSDADMIAEPGEDHFRRRTGEPYPKVAR
ncbi:MAG TPA: cupin domain-containing protein [Caulobacteraceae bacterium]